MTDFFTIYLKDSGSELRHFCCGGNVWDVGCEPVATNIPGCTRNTWMKWASTSGERAALPTSEKNLFIETQGVKILNGDKPVWWIFFFFLWGRVKMQESWSSLEEHPLRSCACRVPFIPQKMRYMQSLTTLTCKFHLLVLASQHTEWGNNIQKLSPCSPLYSQAFSAFFFFLFFTKTE